MKRLTVALALCAALSACSEPPAEKTAVTLPETLEFPEGIALDSASDTIYNASASTGAVVATSVASGQSRTVVAPGVLSDGSAFPGLLGLQLDGSGRLWIAGGRTKTMAVVDTKTGSVLKTFTTDRANSLLNDAAITPEAVYFTDTLEPVMWRVPVTGDTIGELEAWIDFTGTPLAYQEGPNLNGIVPTPDGKTVIAVQMNTGKLFKIDTATKDIAEIDLGGESVPGGDGLVLDGQTLYVVRQPNAEIVTVTLADGLASGKVENRFTDPALLWPATAVKRNDSLLVVNSQFNTRGKDTTAKPFTVGIVPLSKLKAR